MVNKTNKLFEMADSGNCYKVRLLMALLDVPCERIPTDILAGESRTPEFLASNPNGRVPLLILPDGRPLAESNAIIGFLAEGTPLLPDGGYERALVYQWLFFEQYSHEPYVATNRFWLHILQDPDTHAARIAENHPRGLAALGVMNTQLETTPFLTGSRFSIADIALYAYTHVADQGGYNLAAFPAIDAWLQRIRTQPGYVSMDA